MKKIIKELSNKYGETEKIIKILFNIGTYEGKTLEECKMLISKFYEMKVGAN